VKLLQALKRRAIRLKRTYDAAKTHRHNQNHWTNATNDDANSIIGPSLGTLRNRARYEIRNNCYARGIVDTLADDVVGTGPRPQIACKSTALASQLEAELTAWASQCDIGGRLDLTAMLRLTVLQLCDSGETLFVKQYKDDKYRLLMLEPDYLASPYGLALAANVTQGIETDAFGRPVTYYILKAHPGSGLAATNYNTVKADQMIHVFRVDRPGQYRGVPWLTPALELFAQLRRYTQAVLDAAETAADITALLESDSPDLTPVDVDSLDEIEIRRRMMLTLPAGWKMKQFQATQPSSSYKEFKAEIINEIGRCINMPLNVALANSAGYNYASGRLDKQSYNRTKASIRHLLERQFLTPVVGDWLALRRIASGPTGDLQVKWFWPGDEHVDPQKEATAQKARLENLTTSLSAEYSRQGLDWETELQQIARERELLKTLNITAAPAAAEKPDHEQTNEEKDDEKDDPDDDDAE